MPERKLISYVTILWIVLALLAGTGYFLWTRGVYVEVTNNTQNALSDINITYERGAIHVAVLEPKTSHGRYINPSSETDLKLEWLDASGAKHSHIIGVYIETNYSGSVEITVEADGTVSLKDKVKLRIIGREGFDWSETRGTIRHELAHARVSVLHVKGHVV